MFNSKTDKKIFAKGGRNTFKKYGNAYMKMIGLKGGRPRKDGTKPTVDKSLLRKETEYAKLKA